MSIGDFFNAINPIRLIGKGISAVEHLVGKVIETPSHLIAAAGAAVAQVGKVAAKVLTHGQDVIGGVVKGLGNNAEHAVKDLGNNAEHVVSHIGDNAEHSLIGVSKEARGAAADVSQNMMIPLSIGAGLLAIFLIMQMQNKDKR